MVGFGALVWLIPFLVSIVFFPLRSSNRPLFESIMPVVLVFAVVLFSVLYFKKIEQRSLRDGIIVGVVWFVISIAIDLVLFLPPSPMKMGLIDYMADIGLTYLIILMIPVGIGALLNKK